MAVELYDEHEQSERVRNWIKENASGIVIALVIAFAGIFGFRQWQDYQAGQVALAGEYYEVIRQDLQGENLDEAEEQFQAMREAVGGHGYVGLAGLRMASAYVDDGQLGRAEEIYRGILDQRSLGSLRPIATLRLVRVLEAQGEIEQALALLDEPAPTGFAAAWAEARGDLLFERGELDEARMAWQEALDNQGEGGMSSYLIELKLDAAGRADGETS